jgi:chromate transporter
VTVFGVIALTGFGGGQKAQVRRQVVSVKHWITDAEYLEALELAELLPGPNVVNLAILIAQRVRGLPGAVASFLAGTLPSFAFVLLAGALYFSRFDTRPVHAMLKGAAAAGVGLTLANALELTAETRKPVNFAFIAATAIAVSYFKLSLFATMGVFGVLSMGYYALSARKASEEPQ